VLNGCRFLKAPMAQQSKNSGLLQTILSADKNVLICMGCSKPVSWVKADPKKDLSDRYYARKIAGNP
ncbi:hypothetical protein CJF35_21990, partial [Pseudomonas lundensis]